MSVLAGIATWVCVAFVVIGAIPVAAGLYQYLLVPFHAWLNHYRDAAPYLPNVAVVVPAWNEGAVVGTSIDRLVRLEDADAAIGPAAGGAADEAEVGVTAARS